MIHAREDYNRIQDPAGKIPEHEPVFLLRAQDVLAPKIVSLWADENERVGGDPELTQLARDHAHRMRDWQYINGFKVADSVRDRSAEGGETRSGSAEGESPKGAQNPSEGGEK